MLFKPDSSTTLSVLRKLDFMHIVRCNGANASLAEAFVFSGGCLRGPAGHFLTLDLHVGRVDVDHSRAFPLHLLPRPRQVVVNLTVVIGLKRIRILERQ